MKFEKETENKIRKAFRQEDFQNFMFEAVLGESKDKDNELYKNVYKWELEEIEDRLIYLVKSHIHHNVPINRNAIVTFILENIAENLGGDDLDCRNIKFFAFCNHLYYIIFDIVAKLYFTKDVMDKDKRQNREQKYKEDTDQLLYVNSTQQDKRYIRAVEICKGSKIYNTDENDLYELDKELNKFGFKTRMGRNCNTGTLSIAVLEEPETENI